PLGPPVSEQSGTPNHLSQRFLNGVLHWFSTGPVIYVAAWDQNSRIYLNWELRDNYQKVLLQISDSRNKSQVDLPASERVKYSLWDWHTFPGQKGRPYDFQFKGGKSREDILGTDHWSYTDWSEPIRFWF